MPGLRLSCPKPRRLSSWKVSLFHKTAQCWNSELPHCSRKRAEVIEVSASCRATTCHCPAMSDSTLLGLSRLGPGPNAEPTSVLAQGACRWRRIGITLNHKKCFWVQYGAEECAALLGWVATTCPELRDMKSTRTDKFMGTMIGPDGHLHRWNAPRSKFVRAYAKITASHGCLIHKLPAFKIYALTTLEYRLPCRT